MDTEQITKSNPLAVAAPQTHHQRVMGVNLPLTISLGKTRIPLKDVLNMNIGSVIPLDGPASNQVEILVNNALIGWGELVAVDDYYGVRIDRLAK